MNGKNKSFETVDIDGRRLVGSKIGRDLLSFNIGGTYQVANNFSVFGGYEGQSSLDSSANGVHSAGYIGGKWRW
jgi:uncharacterized protein with beta-barrel porin domain